MALAVGIALAVGASAPARADWNGDGPGDVLAVHPDGRLLLYRGNGAGGWLDGAGREPRRRLGRVHRAARARRLLRRRQPDLLARDRGRAAGDVPRRRRPAAGAATRADRRRRLGAVHGAARARRLHAATGIPTCSPATPEGQLLLYRGDGDGGWVTGKAEQIGSGWGPFKAVLAGGRLQRRRQARRLRGHHRRRRCCIYRGNGAGGWETGKGEPVGTGWAGFTALAARRRLQRRRQGRRARPHARTASLLPLPRHGRERLGRQRRARSAAAGTSLTYLTLVPLLAAARAAPPAPAPPPPAPTAPVPDGNVALNAGIRCTPPGGLLRVSVKVRKRSGRPAPRVSRASSSTSARARAGPTAAGPTRVRLRMHRPAGQKGRVYARVYFRRAGSKKLAHQDGVAALRHVLLEFAEEWSVRPDVSAAVVARAARARDACLWHVSSVGGARRRGSPQRAHRSSAGAQERR